MKFRRCGAQLFEASLPSTALSQLTLGLLVQHGVYLPMICQCRHLSDVVALLPVVAKVCSDRRCIEEATDYVACNNKLRASIRGKALLQLLMEVGHLTKKQAYGIMGSMCNILDNVRIMPMVESVDQRRDALLLIVVSLCNEIPAGDRKNIMYVVKSNMSTWAYKYAVLQAQCTYVSRLPRSDGVSLTGCEWVTCHWVTDGGTWLGVYSGIRASGMRLDSGH